MCIRWIDRREMVGRLSGSSKDIEVIRDAYTVFESMVKIGRTYVSGWLT